MYVIHMHVFNQVLQSVGNAVLPFADELIACLKKCVHLKSKTASLHAATVSVSVCAWQSQLLWFTS